MERGVEERWEEEPWEEEGCGRVVWSNTFKFVGASDCASYVVATSLPQRKLGEPLFRHQDANPGRSGEGRVS